MHYWALRPSIPPLLCPYFIQPAAFSPCKFPFRNNPEWLYVSTQKSIGLEQKPSASVNLTFIPPSPQYGIQNPWQYFSSELPVARLELICQGKLFPRLTWGTWLCYCLWGESWGQVQRLRERESKSVPTPAPRESITQPCLCFPNSFWFSRKLWAKLWRANTRQCLRLTSQHASAAVWAPAPSSPTMQTCSILMSKKKQMSASSSASYAALAQNRAVSSSF